MTGLNRLLELRPQVVGVKIGLGQRSQATVAIVGLHPKAVNLHLDGKRVGGVTEFVVLNKVGQFTVRGAEDEWPARRAELAILVDDEVITTATVDLGAPTRVDEKLITIPFMQVAEVSAVHEHCDWPRCRCWCEGNEANGTRPHPAGGHHQYWNPDGGDGYPPGPTS